MRVKHVVSVSGGKDSTATLLMALARVPHEQIEAIFCDTGNEEAQTYRYLDDLEHHLGIRIHRLKADFADGIMAKRAFIAQDRRTRREYQTAPVFDAQGNPVPKRNRYGQIMTHRVKRDGVWVIEPIQKTRKVGGGHKVRWSNKAKRRALDVLWPSGNPFLDLCMWKGRFPSRMAQFCTEELKRNMAVEYQMSLIDAGYTVLSWQGIRRDESPNRKNAKKREKIGPHLWAFRPLVNWTAQQTVDFVRSKGCPLNPLYSQGMDRVGCFPCINVNKQELAQIAWRHHAEIDRIAMWEWIVGQCSKRGFSTMKCDTHTALDQRHVFADLHIRARVAWANNDNGTLSLFNGSDQDALPAPACASAYGLCE